MTKVHFLGIGGSGASAAAAIELFPPSRWISLAPVFSRQNPIDNVSINVYT